MTPPRVLVGLALALATVTGTWSPFAYAQTRECEYDLDTEQLLCTITYTARPGGPELDVDLDGPGGLPLSWRRVLSNGLPGATFICYYQTTDGVTTTEFRGVGWAVYLINTETGEVLSLNFDCEWPGEDPPQPPPPPPTAGELAQSAKDLLTIETSVNPDQNAGGITGLDSWLWCTDPGERATGVSLRGWTATATMSSASYVWTIAGPSSAQRHSTSCGSAPQRGSVTGGDAAAIWQPQTKGEYQIVLTSTWWGTWTLEYGGVVTGTFILGPVEIDAARVTYPVDEFVAVLTSD